MMGQLRIRWINIKPALGEYVAFGGLMFLGPHGSQTYILHLDSHRGEGFSLISKSMLNQLS